MAKKKNSAFLKTTRARLLERLNQQGLGAALRYGLAVSGIHPQGKSAYIVCAPEPLKSMLRGAFENREEIDRERKRAEDVRNGGVLAAREKEKTETLNAAAKMREALSSMPGGGEAFSTLLAAMPVDHRTLVSTPDERKRVIELRKNCAKSTEVKQRLGCTPTELERWSADGRLPVLYRRRMPSSFGSCEVRFWSLPVIDEAQACVEAWRAEDKAEKARRRAQRPRLQKVPK